MGHPLAILWQQHRSIQHPDISAIPEVSGEFRSSGGMENGIGMGQLHNIAHTTWFTHFPTEGMGMLDLTGYGEE